MVQVVQGSISQYDVENGRSACTCICLEASASILEHMTKGSWTGSPEDVAVSVGVDIVVDTVGYIGVQGTERAARQSISIIAIHVQSSTTLVRIYGRVVLPNLGCAV